MWLLCGSNLDDFALRVRLWYGLASLAQRLQMQRNALANQLHYFAARFTHRRAAGKIRHISTVALLSLLYNDKVFHNVLRLGFEARALKDAIQRAYWHIHAELARNSHSSRFRRVPEQAMAALGANVPPALSLQFLDQIANLHTLILARRAAQHRAERRAVAQPVGTMAALQAC